ncbi:hypothetical protein chiPu_0009514 [Chiloscyllium punctatum]|uniref:Tumor necrosis factor receptor superfamily member 16 n=1 Tax=Chiloscyllium punctatum TaxID=137246 RepID=A0A401SKZ9_CHIPU|nr:hypothetical protein [Chiloscyllium punctatum]
MRFLFCLLFISQVLADDSCPSGQFTLQGDCCDFCPVGHGVIKECNITNTQCQPCKDGVTFSPSASFSRCQLCSSCPDKMEVVSLCTATFDIQCQCMEGYYLQPGSRSCSQGFQMLEKCRRDKNVKCELCPEGSSEKASNSQPCAPCRVCDKDEFVLQECQRTSDTVCLSKNSSLLRPQVEPVRDDATWNTCKQKKQLAKARAGELDVGPEGEKLHGDSGVFVDTHSLHEPQLSKVVCADPSVYSKLPLQKRQEVEQLLESQDDSRADWRSLACHLGYDEERVATIGRGEDPAHTLLSDWSMRDNGNLDVLCKALRRMEREDIVECLKSESAVTSLV